MVLSGKLTFNRIAIKSIDIPRKTRIGILLPDTVKEEVDDIEVFEDHPIQGIVIGIGDNVTTCKPGDTILLKGSTRADLLMDKGTLYKIVYEQDILLVREDENGAV